MTSSEDIKAKLRYLASFMSCRRYTELASQALDEPLSAKERLVFRFHHIICLMCRRFNRQITLLQRAAETWETQCCQQPCCQQPSAESGQPQISPEAAQRIKNEIAKVPGD